ncbi:hypothetical protein RFI_00109 [Reticulomyxa filosa]|uniref:Uncharacterized protein n=1 Tax=Reticulomyxa filosa TaxID=46433 RepID=X6PEP6_RETFI|nr:hypothetical protein RFI_00109 [Reticulomyxa filosa]|eukprot:ETO36955.1 hypothetical protein RFI_00109 [Reticulomyxa filosa]
MNFLEVVSRYEKTLQKVNELEKELSALRTSDWTKVITATLSQYRNEVELLEMQKRTLENSHKKLTEEVSKLQSEAAVLDSQMQKRKFCITKDYNYSLFFFFYETKKLQCSISLYSTKKYCGKGKSQMILKSNFSFVHIQQQKAANVV